MVDYGWPWFTIFDNGWPSLTKVYHAFPSFTMLDYAWPSFTMVDHGWLWLTILDDGWQSFSMVHHGFHRLTKVYYGWNMDKWFFRVQVALWHPIMWLCGITMLVKVHVALWHPTMLLWKCDVHHRVLSKMVFVTLRRSWKSRVKSDNHIYVCHVVMLNNNDVRLWCSLVGLSHYNIHNGLCQMKMWKNCLIVHDDLGRILCNIVTSIISYDKLWYA